MSVACTKLSLPGERISASGAESGRTSSTRGAGTSAITVVWPRALQLQVPLDIGVRRPLNRRSSLASAIVCVPSDNATAANGSDECPSIVNDVPRGSRSGASATNVSGARRRYAGYVARMATSPTNGRSTTRTTTVSLSARPSVATNVRSASSGPNSTFASPRSTTMGVSDQALPVVRRRSTSALRPAARIVKRTVLPRCARRGAPGISMGDNSVPRHASTGCTSAAHPSRRDVAPITSAMSTGTSTAPARNARVRSRRSSAGASTSPLRCNRSANCCSATRTKMLRSSASSTTPRTAPSRNDCSRSTAAATAGSDDNAVAVRVPRRATSHPAITTTAHTAKGTNRGSPIHRAPPKTCTPNTRIAAAAASTATVVPACANRTTRARSRIRISIRLMSWAAQ